LRASKSCRSISVSGSTGRSAAVRDNIFDRDYESFGLFGEPDEVLGDAFEDSRFLSPAAPRAAWLGLQLDLR
jgi:hypothetical protein